MNIHTPLAQAMALGKPSLSKVDALILDIIKEEIPLIHDVAEHIIKSGGKRLRPLLTILCSQNCGYDGGREIGLAAAVEFIHTATLLHDDVVDDSSLRRGLATANDVWGNKPSVLVGDFLLSQAFRLMVKDGSIEILDILSKAAAVISKGEVLQLSTEQAIDTSLDVYLQVIQAKTAELFAAACEIAPVIAGDSSKRAVYQEYGMSVGIVFQAIDDMLDYLSTDAALGKKTGDDFREKKVTLPVILLKRRLSGADKALLEKFFSADYTHKLEDLDTIKHWMHAQNIHGECMDFIGDYNQRARKALAQMPENGAKTALEEIIDYGIERVS